MFTQSVSSAALEKALSATWQRRNVITHNIANEDTPGYKAQRLDFEGVLAGEVNNLRRGRAGVGVKEAGIKRLETIQPKVYEDTSTVGRADGNNVDILAEQIELARVEYQYQALSQRVGSHYSTLQYAISGGR